jgi:hypothetical protein
MGSITRIAHETEPFLYFQFRSPTSILISDISARTYQLIVKA